MKSTNTLLTVGHSPVVLVMVVQLTLKKQTNKKKPQPGSRRHMNYYIIQRYFNDGNILLGVLTVYHQPWPNLKHPLLA